MLSSRRPTTKRNRCPWTARKASKVTRNSSKIEGRRQIKRRNPSLDPTSSKSGSECLYQANLNSGVSNTIARSTRCLTTSTAIAETNSRRSSTTSIFGRASPSSAWQTNAIKRLEKYSMAQLARTLSLDSSDSSQLDSLSIMMTNLTSLID